MSFTRRVSSLFWGTLREVTRGTGVPGPVRPCIPGVFGRFPSRCSSQAPAKGVRVAYRHGRPVLSLPLPSRVEDCRFSIRPMLMTVGDLLRDIRAEDPGVHTAALLNGDGGRVSSSTPMDMVLNKDFQLLINHTVYDVHSPGRESHEHATGLDDVKFLVQVMHSALALQQHRLDAHAHLLHRKDAITQALGPMEQERAKMMLEVESQAAILGWAGLAYLSLQGGFLSYLTWFVYPWDVMEPITYFITYTTSMIFFSYYILTKQDFVYKDARERHILNVFYKTADEQKFDIQRYNQLRNQLAEVERDLKRLRSSIKLQLPVDHIQPNAHTPTHTPPQADTPV